MRSDGRCPAIWNLRFETTFARGCRGCRPSLAAIMAVGPLGEVWGEAPLEDDGDVDIVTMDDYSPLMKLWEQLLLERIRSLRAALPRRR